MKLLNELRRPMPHRRLALHEALVLAERQASRFLSLSGLTQPPFPAEAVTELPFVRVAVRTPMRAAGATKWVKPRWVILLNGLEPGVRQRFSLAHELKHILDHPLRTTLYGTGSTGLSHEEVEAVCNYFAACLLMPRSWVKEYFGYGVQELGALAKLFEVSQQAMDIRLKSLGLTERWDRHGRPVVYYREASPPLLLPVLADIAA